MLYIYIIYFIFALYACSRMAFTFIFTAFIFDWNMGFPVQNGFYHLFIIITIILYSTLYIYIILQTISHQTSFLFLELVFCISWWSLSCVIGLDVLPIWMAFNACLPCILNLFLLLLKITTEYLLGSVCLYFIYVFKYFTPV